MSTEHPDLHTWIEERETIYNSNPEETTEFEWVDDRHYAYPKLLAGVRAVLELHKPVVEAIGDTTWCDWCGNPWPCSTVQKLQGAINDDA